MVNNVHKIMHNVEVGFNVLACVPVVGVFTSALRIAAGKVQAVAGAVLATVGFVGELVSKDPKWKKVTKLGCEHFIHGVLNIFRGLGELVVGKLGLYIGVGSLVLIIPNIMKNGEKFGPVYDYSQTN